MNPDAGPATLLLVTVGTDHHPFDRVVRWVDEYVAAATGDELEFVCQHGTAAPPSTGTAATVVEHDRLLELVRRARVVVCHAGPSTVIETLRLGRIPIVVPRRHVFGEAVDDHQVEFTPFLQSRWGVVVADSREQLHEAITRAVEHPEEFAAAGPPDGATDTCAAVDRFAEIVGALPRACRGACCSAITRHEGDWSDADHHQLTQRSAVEDERNRRVSRKRLMDLTVVTLLAPPGLPLVVACAIAARICGGRGILVRSPRAGLNGRPIVVLKLRTEPAGEGVAAGGAQQARWRRRLGAFLRSSGLDELPQLWNVIRGDMSIVGPRPLTADFVDRYSAEQRRRLDVRPGMTGWAQVTGRATRTWPESFALDVWYVEHGSLRLDLRILALTAHALIRRGAGDPEPHSSKPEFLG